jgi:hypothetical protein
MASVQINIPGIGNVVADNAASEETLQKILAAMQGKGGAGGGGATGGGQMSAKSLKEQEKEIEARKKNTKATEDDTKQQNKNNQQSEATSNYMKTLGKSMSTGISQVGGAFTGFVSTLAQTAAAVASAFATSYDQMAENPIGAAATMLSTNIDLAGAAAKAAVDVAAGLGTAAAGILGPFSGVATGLINGMSAAAKAVVDFATTILKMANEIFAKEFQKSADALKEYTKVGASFAGGMMEMRDIAHDSGMGMKQLQSAVAASSEEIKLMGVTHAEAARMMARGAKTLATTMGTSGNTVRDELLALGYSYEEQAGLVAQVNALDKASGATRRMSDAELAATTRTYAKDLKVLADITGKDAKKAMEEAAKKGMEADIMAQLSPEEAKKFQAAYASMPDYAKKGFLEYVSSGGTAITDQATNIAMSQNAEVEKLIKGSYDTIKDSGKDASQAQKETLKQASAAGQAQRELNKANGNAIGVANRLGGSLQGAADMQNQISSSALYNADAVDESTTAAESQATATDGLTKGYQDLTAQMTGFQNQMEKFATDNLPAYANILAKNAAETMAYFQEALKIAVDFAGYVKGKIDELEGGNKKKPGVEVTPEQKAANAAAENTAQILADPNASTAQKEQAEVDESAAAYAARQANLEAKNARLKAAKESRLKKFAFGGITDETAIFGEQGIEAAVPLPDGRTIPVTLSGAMQFPNVDGMLAESGNNATNSNSTNEEFLTEIKELFQELIQVYKQSQNAGPMNDLVKHMEEMKDTASKQLGYHITMADLMGDQKDISQGLLNNSY